MRYIFTQDFFGIFLVVVLTVILLTMGFVAGFVTGSEKVYQSEYLCENFIDSSGNTFFRCHFVR